MHPTLLAALAVERHNDLLRTVEQHRRARLARTPRLTRHEILKLAVAPMGQRWQQLRPGKVTVQLPAPAPCCA